MKKYLRGLALVLMLALAGSYSSSAQAMLTEEEQLANRQKDSEAEKIIDADKEAGASGTEKESGEETQDSEPASGEQESESAAEAQDGIQGTGDGPLVAIDPGHQGPGQDMSGVEPNGPGSDIMKARLATGPSGCVSGLDEYELDLDVSLKLRDELIKRGYRVIMTRETHDIDISNIERCQVANEAGADILLRIHANGSEDGSVSGALTAAPSASNPYVSDIYESCMKLADDLINAYCETTGLYNRGIWITDDMTGINWSDMPVTILEMGFMTNPGDDAYMADAANQDVMVQGIANGVDRYFGR
nr:N-acetylmuramoyl-L-alanine amidase [uncultured Marvinbryantia sp.]